MTVSLEQTGMLALLKGDNMEEERQVDRYVPTSIDRGLVRSSDGQKIYTSDVNCFIYYNEFYTYLRS
jgi:hypothetical protein